MVSLLGIFVRLLGVAETFEDSSIPIGIRPNNDCRVTYDVSPVVSSQASRLGWRGQNEFAAAAVLCLYVSWA